MDKSEIKIKKIRRWGSRSPVDTELGHFTLLFCRGRQRNVPRIITHVHSYCSALKDEYTVSYRSNVLGLCRNNKRNRAKTLTGDST